ncbi:MAG: S-layer domain protein [Nitrosopumilales archaeon]|nr:MAG: S-layer domain protein [Nitrosopumilales archaeon]
MKFLRILPIFLILLVLISNAEAETINQTMEGGMDIEITYPSKAVIDRTISISFLVKNNGWEDKQDVIFVFGSSNTIMPIKKNEIRIDKISAGGSYGETVDFKIAADASPGSHFLNLEYSQVLLANNEEPRPATQTNIAIPILIKEQPKVTIHTITPESLFTNAEFPFTVEIISEDIDINDVRLEIIPPPDVDFRGETLHTFSSIQQNVPISVTARIITPSQEINTEYKIPFQVIVSYLDDIGQEETDSKTISILMRPRTFMELTTDGGIWIGDFFIAPYVSLGTIIGIPAGAIFSLALRKKFSGSKKSKRKKN